MGYIFTIVSLIFISNSLYSSREIIINLGNIRTILIICVTFSTVYTLVIYLLVFLYKFVLELLSAKKIRNHEIIGVYTRANLCKYLPGNVMQFVVRNLYAEKIGLSQTLVAFGSFLEVLIIVSVSAALCILIMRELFFMVLADVMPRNFYVALFVGLLMLLCIMLMIAKKTQLVNKIKKYFVDHLGSIKISSLICFIAKSTAIIIFFHIVSGLMFFYLIKTVSGAENVSLFIVISAYIVAWLVGFITPGSPGGIGIKEAVLLLTLTESYGREYVLITALLFRIVTIVADVLAFCFHLLFENSKKIKNKS